MWYLVSEHDARIIYVLPGQEIIIGRSADGQNCNFAVPGDPSLSRKHASLSIADGNLNLQDLGSKYGTFINGSTEKLECNQKLVLVENCIVKFGKMNCEWKVQKANFVTCTSTLKGENIQNLRLILAKLGGILKSDWDDSCAYLTMPAITLTIKVVLALVQGSFIVTTDYWNKCLEAASNNTNLPDPTHFTPQIVETTLNKETVSFLPDTVRKSLFTEKKFIFFSKRQLDMYRPILEKSSAIPLLLSETKMSKSTLCAEDVIVIQCNIVSISQETESQREQIKEIENYLKSKGKRFVADAEIGLAILYCSMEKYCNPDFNFTLEVMKQSSGQASKGNNILAQETQNPSQVIFKQENIKIDESLTEQENYFTTSDDNSMTGKRKLNDNEVTTNAAKKMATGNNVAAKLSNNKRAADDSNDTNPSKKMAVDTSADDEFNFIKSSNKSSEGGTKMLNFMKPIKRKMDEQDDEDGLFNFVTKKPATEQSINSNSNADFNNEDESDPDTVAINCTTPINEKVDITALRGAKLSELMQQTLNMEVNNKALKVIKTEENDSEEFGSTVIVVQSDLIKREPLPIKEETETSNLKNFKKFKKVWPLKIQASMSKLAISV